MSTNSGLTPLDVVNKQECGSEIAEAECTLIPRTEIFVVHNLAGA
jgi:hypothetical protein